MMTYDCLRICWNVSMYLLNFPKTPANIYNHCENVSNRIHNHIRFGMIQNNYAKVMQLPPQDNNETPLQFGSTDSSVERDLDSWSQGRRFDPHPGLAVVSLSKTLNPH